MLFLVVYGVIFKVKSIVEKRYFFLVLYLLFIYKEDCVWILIIGIDVFLNFVF